MDRRRRPDQHSAAAVSSPQPPLSTPSHLLSDVSNLKTPRPHSKNPNPNPPPSSPLFFTASKNTPHSSYSTPALRNRNSTAPAPASRSKTARKLKALELEQSRSARRAHSRREKALGSLARSLTAWVNFLLQNPKACGCRVGSPSADYQQSGGSSSKGKRRSLDGEAMFMSGKLRSPKRQRAATDGDVSLALMKPAVTLLEKSLCDVCSLEDMRERMLIHMSRKSCNEVLLSMSQVCKNIDEGRLKMKLHCPLVNDLAVREKAVKALMCYNPLWLRIGLHILFGGDSLLLANGDQDGRFLKEFIEKYLLTHVGLARKYALNKLVGGVYMPGYYEALGSVILKRFLLLAIALDRAKCESSLSIKHGIDSIDGGSPLLFISDSPIKSSRQVIKEFLIESMHGEGDLLAHLVILRCKVNYEQSPLCEYDFKVKNIFEDFRDGILLCRMVQLLLCSETILPKVRSPSDTLKKNLQNCSTAMQYLKDCGVELSDSDGVMVTAADIANGDKELTCSILWNVFVHLQVPLLINRALLIKEIVKIKGSDVELSEYNAFNEMDLLLHWIQAVCATQNVKIDSFSSLDDGRALSCLINYYFGNDIHHPFLEKEKEDESNNDWIMRIFFHSPALLDIAYIQNVTARLGNSPKVLHPCNIFDEDACIDERSTVILLIFYASRLIRTDKLDIMDSFRSSQQTYHSPVLKHLSISRLNLEGSSTRHPSPEHSVHEFVCPHKKFELGRYTSKDIIQKIQLIQLWWRDLLKRRKYCRLKWAASILQTFVRCNLARRHNLERSAIFIQARLRGFIKRTSFLKTKRSIILLQSVVRAWLTVRFESISKYRTVTCSSLSSTNGTYDRYLMFMIDRQRFHRKVKSVILIQQFVRTWIRRKYDHSNLTNSKMNASEISGVVVRQSANTEGSKTLDLRWMAATRIQESWKGFLQNMHLKRSCAAIKIQSHCRCWSTRKYFVCQVEATKIIQSTFRSVTYQKGFQKKHIAAVEMQSFIRGHLVRTKLLGASKIRSSRIHQSSYNAFNDSNFELRKLIGSVVKLQSWWKQVLLHRSMTHAAISYQSFIRGWIARRDAAKRKQSISTIQNVWKNMLQNRVQKSSILVIQACIRSWVVRHTTIHKKCCIVKIQRWWRNILHIKKRKISVLIIQTHVRGLIARKKVAQSKHDIVRIQSCWKGYLVRKHSRPQLLNLRHRMKLSAVNVNDEMRLINRLVVALTELLGCKSISNIRHTCTTLDTATELSQKCCETLVAAGAIDILLKQIQLLNRGIPDQEVLKHVLSILRNIVRYKDLSHVLVNTPRSVEIIFQEMLRNKSEGFVISCQLLRRICTIQEGLETTRKLRGYGKRLKNVIVKLERKVKFLRRKAQINSQKDDTERKLREAMSLMSLIYNS